jgi:hypothetical protein
MIELKGESTSAMPFSLTPAVFDSEPPTHVKQNWAHGEGRGRVKYHVCRIRAYFEVTGIVDQRHRPASCNRIAWQIKIKLILELQRTKFNDSLGHTPDERSYALSLLSHERDPKLSDCIPSFRILVANNERELDRTL